MMRDYQHIQDDIASDSVDRFLARNINRPWTHIGRWPVEDLIVEGDRIRMEKQTDTHVRITIVKPDGSIRTGPLNAQFTLKGDSPVKGKLTYKGEHQGKGYLWVFSLTTLYHGSARKRLMRDYLDWDGEQIVIPSGGSSDDDGD